MTVPPFQRVLDRLHELMPTLETRPSEMMKAINLVNVWLQMGCDVDLDILPAINNKWRLTPTGVKVFSAFYFDGEVRQAMEKRTGAEAHKKREEQLLMQGYAWKRARGFPLSDAKLKQLADYEAKNGAIIVEPIKNGCQQEEIGA